jgi:hypothetical protein
MPTETPVAMNTFSPHYCIINRSEPQYELIKKHLLNSIPHIPGSSQYFIRAGRGNCCICRIRPGNGTVLFYEILNHCQEGITETAIASAISDPANASPLEGYFYIPETIERKLTEHERIGSGYSATGCKTGIRT